MENFFKRRDVNLPSGRELSSAKALRQEELAGAREQLGGLRGPRGRAERVVRN